MFVHSTIDYPHVDKQANEFADEEFFLVTSVVNKDGDWNLLSSFSEEFSSQPTISSTLDYHDWRSERSTLPSLLLLVRTYVLSHFLPQHFPRRLQSLALENP
ncbi:hypothetical protein L798_10754 [Zootermopsis nevadensis]|uniref:Uncharacterized protein n=1 Tax=Zootermopsis nevadensis TaxID=136037 RepID=A0A067R5M5_ZOONE|nr:hypothetical protein L798_10754 [Zootermopsis nevadensis]